IASSGATSSWHAAASAQYITPKLLEPPFFAAVATAAGSESSVCPGKKKFGSVKNWIAEPSAPTTGMCRPSTYDCHEEGLPASETMAWTWSWVTKACTSADDVAGLAESSAR